VVLITERTSAGMTTVAWSTGTSRVLKQQWSTTRTRTWVPVLGILTTGCLVLYFLVAIAMHIRMRDLGRNLFLNATGMLTICTATLAVCFLM
jgi:hypothetical protein